MMDLVLRPGGFMQATAMVRLEQETLDLVEFLAAPERGAPDQYEVVEARLAWFDAVARQVEADMGGDVELLRRAQDRFRAATDPVFLRSWLMRRIRTWPEGYPGDYLTLEAMYGGPRPASEGVGAHLDRYAASRTLAVAVRSRLRKLAALLRERAEGERLPSRWLNLACGSCRELLSVPAAAGRTVLGVDQDPRALAYARDLVAPTGHALETRDMNALRFARAEQTLRRFGPQDVIYSAGLFDYIETETLVRLLAGLHGALAPEGLLLASFKDRRRYDTQDYHWISRWHFFLQRTEEEFRAIVERAGVPPHRYTVERDESGVILFFLIRR
jgi:hypothetical protein